MFSFSETILSHPSLSSKQKIYFKYNILLFYYNLCCIMLNEILQTWQAADEKYTGFLLILQLLAKITKTSIDEGVIKTVFDQAICCGGTLIDYKKLGIPACSSSLDFSHIEPSKQFFWQSCRAPLVWLWMHITLPSADSNQADLLFRHTIPLLIGCETCYEHYGNILRETYDDLKAFRNPEEIAIDYHNLVNNRTGKPLYRPDHLLAFYKHLNSTCTSINRAHRGLNGAIASPLFDHAELH